jgi:hypothetical protein
MEIRRYGDTEIRRYGEDKRKFSVALFLHFSAVKGKEPA